MYKYIFQSVSGLLLNKARDLSRVLRARLIFVYRMITAKYDFVVFRSTRYVYTRSSPNEIKAFALYGLFLLLFFLLK